MLTWGKVLEWSRNTCDSYPDSGRYSEWFWTALLATYGTRSSRSLLQAAAQLATQHCAHPDYAIGSGMRVCDCHMQPRRLTPFGTAVWEGDASAAAWYHLPLVKAYFLALLGEDEERANLYLLEFAEWRQSRAQAFDIARGIGDIPRAHALARQIVGEDPRRVYFFCRRDGINDPELLECARHGLLEDPNLLQAPWCAQVTGDTEFSRQIATARVVARLRAG